MPIDNARLQVLANHCAAAAEAMGHTLMRTAYSTFVKETEDFSCQLMTVDGKTFASPRSMGATWFTGLDYGPVIRMFDDYREGDLYCTNDPYSGFVATHSPDLHIWRPVFNSGQLICFVGCHIHNTDVGGAVPASLSRSLTEVYQEGVRIPPSLLMRDGVLDDHILRTLHINVRAPEQNRGDLNAQIACLTIAERKVQEIVKRFGLHDFQTGIEQLLDYAEQQARVLIKAIPDGDYFFADYADEDSDGGQPCRIAVTLRVRGDELEVDYTGSDPQVASSQNIPTGGDPRHALVMVGVVYSLYALDPTITLNSGLVRPVRAVLPEGSVVNPHAPAAVGMRSLMGAVTQTTIFGAFSQALPDLIPAAGSGGMSLMNVKTADRTGKSVMASIGPVGGGAGGGPAADGAEGCGANASYLKNTPVEINEVEVPIRILRYGLVSDTGGPGEFRGGNSAIMEFKLFAPQSMVTARNRNQSRMSPWGVLGGRAGAVSRFIRNPGHPDAEDLGNRDIVHCDPGDVILVQGAAGGGYGAPFRRPVAKVLADVERGFISPAFARAEYGMAVLPDGTVDEATTASLRRDMAQQAPNEHFHHGPGRRDFEAVWTEPRYAMLTRILAALPVNWRFYVKHQLFAALADSPPTIGDGATEVVRAYEDIRQRFTDLPAMNAA